MKYLEYFFAIIFLISGYIGIYSIPISIILLLFGINIGMLGVKISFACYIICILTLPSYIKATL